MNLSIVIPFFNSEKYIGDCIDSLLHQGLSHQEYELILINDGSTDKGMQIVKNFCERYNNIVFIDDSNKGVYYQRNRGLQIAKGKFVLFMDADDYLLKDSLGKLLKFALKNDLDLMGFNSVITNQRYDSTIASSIGEEEDFKIMTGVDYLLENPKTRLEIWWYLINKTFIDASAISFYEGYFHADVPFTIDIWLKAKKTAFCPLNVHWYYQSENSIMRSNLRQNYSITRYNSSLVMLNKISKILNDFKEKQLPGHERVLRIMRTRTDEYCFFFIIGIFRSSLPISLLNKALNSLKKSGVYPMKQYIKDKEMNLKLKSLIKLFNHPKMVRLLFRLYRIMPKSGTFEKWKSFVSICL